MPALPLLPFVPRVAAGALLCCFAASALAGVISGTGTEPSASQLGATDAVAMQRSASHRGHVLLTPYYTAQNGQMTVLHFVNTDRENGKAIKLRIRDAANGDSLQSVTLLLSPGDMWTGAITAGADGSAWLTTADESCTLPKIRTFGSGSRPLRLDRLDRSLSVAERYTQMREGTVEAILAADIPFKARSTNTGTDYSALRKAMAPVSSPPRCDDQAIYAALLQDFDNEGAAAAMGFATPSGGISGTWYIIDVPGATTFSSAMTALEAVNAAGKPARGNYVLFPASDQAIAQPERFTADPLLVSVGLAGHEKNSDGMLAQPTTAAVEQAQAYDLPDLSTPYRLPPSPANAARTAAEASQAFAARDVSNQFSVEPSISAQTDWVFGLPTKRYSVALDHSTGMRTFSAVPPAGEGPQYFHTNNTWANAGRVCFSDSVFYTYTRAGYGGLIYPNPASMHFCGAVTVVPINQLTQPTTSLLASSVAKQRTPSPPSNGTAGWSGLTISGPAGVPLIGDAFMKLVNPNAAPGVAANYGLLFPHVVIRP